MASCPRAFCFLDFLLKFGEGFFGCLCLFAFRIELEIGLELGDGFVFLLHLLRDLGQGEVGGRELGLDVDGVLRTKVGALIVFVAQIELCYGEIFVDAFVIGLHSFNLREFAMNGGAFGGIRRIAFGGGVVGGGGVGIVAAGTGAGATAGVVAGELGRRLCGEGMLIRGIGGSGCLGTRRAWRIGGGGAR